MRDHEQVFVVYVIAFRDARGEAFYVGQTAKAPETRLREHVMGHKFCRSCHARRTLGGVRSAKIVYTGFLASRAHAEREETRIAREMKRSGRRVYGGH